MAYYCGAVSPQSTDRESYFPAIEKRYGEPMSYWFEQMKQVSGRKYPEQIAYLRENYGFSQAHANALVQYCRGSKSSRRFETLEDYLAPLDAGHQETIRAIFAAIQGRYRSLELVIAWNHPILKKNDTYLFGVMAAKNHILIAPMVKGVLEEFTPRLQSYGLNKKTIQVPVDWNVDGVLLRDMIRASLEASGNVAR